MKLKTLKCHRFNSFDLISFIYDKRYFITVKGLIMVV